jgi:hypothetical protein
LACTAPAWQPQSSFVNLITTIKKVCGTSFGTVLRHPRCSESNKDKISREVIDR